MNTSNQFSDELITTTMRLGPRTIKNMFKPYKYITTLSTRKISRIGNANNVRSGFPGARVKAIAIPSSV